jgi:hypothetical protein
MFRLSQIGVLLTLLGLLLFTAVPGMADDQVPFKASLHGFAVSDIPTADNPAIHVIGVELDRNATHLGRFHDDLTHLFNVETLAFTGFSTLTAANGDTFSTVFFGQGFLTDDPEWITFEVTHVIVGGTGRFTGASGTFVGVGGLFNLVTGEDIAGYLGTISTPGANKK